MVLGSNPSSSNYEGLFTFSEPRLKSKTEFIISAAQAASKDRTKGGILILIDYDFYN